jgi:hypothetical protein
MAIIIYFLAFSVVTMGLILQFDKKQTIRIHKILKETRDVQPLFLMRSAEEKLRNLNVSLYGNMVAGSDIQGGRIYINESIRQLAATRLTETVNSYHAGEIQLKEYNTSLNEITAMVNAAREMNFEQVRY